MSAEQLPEKVVPSGLFARQACLKGSVAIAGMARLAECLSSGDGTVHAELLFAREEGKRVIKGKLRAAVFISCQRCLQPMPYEIATVLHLALDSDSLLERIELAEDRLELQDIIEDELILSLPIAPTHENEDCSTVFNAVRTGETEQATDSRAGRNNPFAVLQVLKKDRKD